jgi:hypothetical protein
MTYSQEIGKHLSRLIEVNGSSKRPDGGTLHITLSLDRSKGRSRLAPMR